jgi:glyceraldehyde 3-phosphate dehydrogenase
MKIALNGFGRIGRSLFRLFHDPSHPFEVVAINDLSEPESLRYLMQYDSVRYPFEHNVSIENGHLVTPKQKTKLLQHRNIEDLPWKDMDIDVVIECTGVFRERAQLEQHLSQGAKRVVLTVPAKDSIDCTLVLGVNDDALKKEHTIISNASCTTNCLAPLVDIFHKALGIEQAFMTTVHAYTNDQALMDQQHKDFRRGRAAAQNIIPTTTGAAKAVGKIIPSLEGKIDGIAMRVPVINGSIVDLTFVSQKDTSVDQINQLVQEAAQGPFKGLVEYATDPLVSTDIIGNTHSSIFDSQSTSVIGKTMVKVLSWYDNEWGYSCRIADLLHKIKNL